MVRKVRFAFVFVFVVLALGLTSRPARAVACVPPATNAVCGTVADGSQFPPGASGVQMAEIIENEWSIADFDCSTDGSTLNINGKVGGACPGPQKTQLTFKGVPGGAHEWRLQVICPVVEVLACDTDDLPYNANFGLDGATPTNISKPAVYTFPDNIVIEATSNCAEVPAMGRTAQLAAVLALLGLITVFVIRRRS